ncbi:cytochrome P450 [Xylaria sp. FL0933]|nr:cytochrome P450 [Xylaria sp. FL0933]
MRPSSFIFISSCRPKPTLRFGHPRMALQSLLNICAEYAIYIFVAYCLILSGYRILLHPLRDYPGPLIAKLSDSYGAYYSLRRRLHLTTRRDHLRYGNVIRQGPNKLVFNSSQALQDIYNNDRVEKSKVYLATLLSPHPNLFNVIDRNAHRTKRKLIGSVLSEHSMRTFEPTMADQINIFIRQLRLSSSSSDPVNLSERTKLLTLDIVGHLAFGYSLNLQTETKNHCVVSALRGGNYRLNTYMQYPFLARLHLEVFVYIMMLLKKGSYLRLLQTMITSRLSEEKHAKHDLYSIVADNMNTSQGESITLSELWSEALFFFPAGGESISTAISSLFFYLSRNPDSYIKLKDEIRTTFNDAEEICGGKQLASCKYLRACIEEALRLAPPAPGTLWRERASTDDRRQPFIIDGHVIPDGTIFGVNMYTLHHNEEYFPEPFSFKPERWLSFHTSEVEMKRMQSAFAPFSLGTRGCAGKSMAYLEVSLVIAKTIWHFDFSMPSGPLSAVGAGSASKQEIIGREREGEFQLDDIFTAGHDGPYLTFRPRDMG